MTGEGLGVAIIGIVVGNLVWAVALWMIRIIRLVLKLYIKVWADVIGDTPFVAGKAVVRHVKAAGYGSQEIRIKVGWSLIELDISDDIKDAAS